MFFSKYRAGKLLPFLCFWVVTFIIYFPAANAGRVGDFPGWVKNVTTLPFWDYVDRTQSGIPSLYQFTQIITWCLYQLFGANAWLWHVLYVTMHALNAWLLFAISRRIFADAHVQRASLIAGGGCLLFCCCPHISEVVVWEPSFHYLLALMLMLLILRYVQQYMHGQHSRYPLLAGALFACSIFSLEIFYITPLLTAMLALFYFIGLRHSKKTFTKTLFYFLVPQAILFIVHLLLVNAVYHSGIGHIGTSPVTLSTDNLSKPLKYIFHVLLFGRYFPDDLRQKIYHFCSSLSTIVTFYSLLTVICGVALVRFRHISGKGKATLLLFLWSLLALLLIVPVWFLDSFIVIYDRYTYVFDAFVYIFLAAIIDTIASKYVATTIWGLYMMVNIYFTCRVNHLWQVSGGIVDTLVNTFPNQPNKTVLILNVPECYYGVQMIGSRDDGEFKMLYNAVRKPKVENPIYEVSAFNITSPDDGAHVTVINDSVVHVTLNQWGTWWWWYGAGAGNFENDYYRLNMTDEGHWYELTVKKPVTDYLLLFISGNKWKTVDMQRKNVDQF
jgi:hypothetical protein